MQTYPRPTGLYDPRFEHDACGVSFVANVNGVASREIVAMGIGALCNMEHRGATGAEPVCGGVDICKRPATRGLRFHEGDRVRGQLGTFCRHVRQMFKHPVRSSKRAQKARHPPFCAGFHDFRAECRVFRGQSVGNLV